MLEQHKRLGAQIALSKIIGALDTDGVKKVELTEPRQDILCTDGEFIKITETILTEA